MADTKKRKSFRTFAEDLRAIRRRPLTQEQIDRINKVFEKDVAAENEKLSEVGKKIAHNNESEVDA